MDKKYDNKQSELNNQKFWSENNIYTQENNPGPIYSIDTPPPTVSGSLHIGHVFSYTQTDIIARYKRMSGFSVFYPLGFDDNGLPTEKYVEKKLKVKSHQIGRSEFIKLCLEETKKVEKEFESLFKKLGFSTDWSLTYSTIDNNSRKISQASFIELYKKGFIYRKEEPAIYCTACRTTVAQAELDDLEMPSFFNDIIFKSGKENLIVSTTRPELLASTSALLYNPKDDRYQHLKNQKAIVPIYNFEIPIFEDEDVDIKKGTGIVMVSTFGDKQDIIWAKRYKLPFKQSIKIDGKWSKISGPLENLKLVDARKKIIELLKSENLIVNQKQITHSVNVHERCKKEIEYLILPQWFLKILPYKEEFLKQAELIEWYPTFMKSRYKNWVENISWDWCLSRQRFYGIPFPVWHCIDCNEIILAEVKDLPIDPQETNYKSNCPKCSKSNIMPDTDVMDTWNTSSLSPYLCKLLKTKNFESLFENQNNFIPMNMRPQAHDIIRTWAFYTIVKAWMHQKAIPWKKIVISGHVLSDKKEKLSKSKENKSLTPEALLEKYPADAIRFWTASGGLGQDIAFSENQLLIGKKLITKLWNAFRFIHIHIQDFDNHKMSENLGASNEWLLHNLSECFEKYTKYFENNEFSLALDSLEKFFWNIFCDNYLELIKDQLFKPEKYNSEEINATLCTLHHAGLRILQLYSPFIPHITEEIYSLVYKKDIKSNSIHQTKFEKFQQKYVFESSNILMSNILSIIGEIRKLKTEKQISLKTEIENLEIFSENEKLLNSIKNQENLIKGITQAKKIEFSNQKLENYSDLKKIDDLWFAKTKTNNSK